MRYEDIDCDLCPYVDLLTVPPGFTDGLSPPSPATPISQDPVGVSDLLFSDQSSVLSWTEQTARENTQDKEDEVS